MVTGRLEQRDGNDSAARLFQVEIIIDDNGPTLRWAAGEVTKNEWPSSEPAMVGKVHPAADLESAQPQGVGAMGSLTTAEVAAWLRTSCERQGLSTKVTDPDVLARVAAILASQTSAATREAQLEPSSDRLECGLRHKQEGGVSIGDAATPLTRSAASGGI